MDEYDIIAITDIHLGHPHNPTKKMLDNLSQVIYTNLKIFKNVRMITFLGDIFHKLLSYSDPDIVLINDWFITFFKFAENNGIIVRMLKGTPSHDYDQQESIASLVTKDTYPKLNFKYIDKIDIEHNTELGIDILYVPDQCHTPRVITMEHIYNVLSTAGLDNVHFAFMHGAFDYQIPFNLESTYLIEDFSFVLIYVLIGHIHTHKPNKHILPPGSFDRIAFGEMEKKGIIHVTVNPHTGARFKFIENKGAMLFDTVTLIDNDLDKNKKIILSHIVKRPCKQLMIKISSIDIDFKEIVMMLKDRGIKPTINKIYERESKEEIELLEINEVTEVNETNISELLNELIDIPDNLKSIYEDELNGIINTYIL